MAVKTNGAEFRRFYNDPEIWVGSTYHDDTLILENGVEVEEYDEISDEAIVTIECGTIFPEGDYSYRGEDMLAVFRKWKKSQNTAVLVIEFDKSKLDEISAHIKKIGVKIISK